jgi:PhnB protein
VASKLNPYIAFRGSARQALEFYQSVLGGELNLNTFAEFQASDDPAEADHIMHGQLETPAGFTLMGGDMPKSMPFEDGETITICLSGDDESELRGYWDGLAQGAKIGMPLELAPWGDHYGQLTDQFGIGWMVNIAGPGQS